MQKGMIRCLRIDHFWLLLAFWASVNTRTMQAVLAVLHDRASRFTFCGFGKHRFSKTSNYTKQTLSQTFKNKQSPDTFPVYCYHFSSSVVHFE